MTDKLSKAHGDDQAPEKAPEKAPDQTPAENPVDAGGELSLEDLDLELKELEESVAPLALWVA